jgi:hypothetical protein
MARTDLSMMYAASVAGFAGGGAVHQALYEWHVVPQLPNLQSVPLHWWAGLMLPSVLGVLLPAALVRSRTCFVRATFFGGLASHLLATLLAWAHRPGRSKSLALEAPAEWWTLGLLLHFVYAGMALALGLLALRVIRWHLGLRPRAT